MIPFTPGATVSLAATTSTARVALPLTKGPQLRVSSLAANALTFIKFGTDTVNAAATDFPILPGTVTTITVPPGATHVAGVTGTSTATLYFTAGDGE
jgi:hypothetical protein